MPVEGSANLTISQLLPPCGKKRLLNVAHQLPQVKSHNNEYVVRNIHMPAMPATAEEFWSHLSWVAHGALKHRGPRRTDPAKASRSQRLYCTQRTSALRRSDTLREQTPPRSQLRNTPHAAPHLNGYEGWRSACTQPESTRQCGHPGSRYLDVKLRGLTLRAQCHLFSTCRGSVHAPNKNMQGFLEVSTCSRGGS